MNAELIQTAVTRAGQMLSQGTPVQNILAHLVNTAEQVIGNDAVSSILILDKEGLLRNGASPKLPYDYLKAIDGLKPNPNVGTCAAAAATGCVVVTPDFQADNKWAELRHLPLALGFFSAWSVPIKNRNGEVIGTFGTYFREKKVPLQKDIDAVSILAQAAAEALYP